MSPDWNELNRPIPRHNPPDDLARAADRVKILKSFDPHPEFAAEREAQILKLARAADLAPLTVIPAERPVRGAARGAAREGRARAWPLPIMSRRVALIASAVCIALVAVSVLTATANAGTPFYTLRKIVVGVVGVHSAPTEQVNLHQARVALQRFNDAAHAGDDANAHLELTKLTQANLSLEQAIQHEPDGAGQSALRAKYNDLLGQEYMDLRQALPPLSWPMRVEVTSVMRELDTAGIIVVSRARVAGVKSPSAVKSSGQMTIFISGANFQPGAILLVNGINYGHVTVVSKSSIVAHLPARQVSDIDSIGVGLPDDTAASTRIMSFGARAGSS